MNFIPAKLSPSITKMIRMDHTHVVTQFHKLTPDTSPGVRNAVVRTICTALEIHAQLEEEIFYPALRQANIGGEALQKSEPEHAEVKRLVERLRSQEDQPDAQRATLNDLMNAVMHHVADEETRLIPDAEAHLSAERLSELGARMTERRVQLAAPRTAELVTDMARGAPAKTTLLTLGAVLAGTVLVSRMRRNRYID